MKTKIYCLVVNGGDGSAYTRFFDNLDVAKWIENESEGFAESAITEHVIEHEASIKIEKMKTAFQTYLDLFNGCGSDKQLDDFLNTFFPEGLPEFRIDEEKLDRSNKYAKIMVGDECVGKVFIPIKFKMENLLKQLRRVK